MVQVMYICHLKAAKAKRGDRATTENISGPWAACATAAGDH